MSQRTRTSVVPNGSDAHLARVRGGDTANHPLQNIPSRSVYARGYSPLGQSNPTVRIRKVK